MHRQLRGCCEKELSFVSLWHQLTHGLRGLTIESRRILRLTKRSDTTSRKRRSRRSRGLSAENANRAALVLILFEALGIGSPACSRRMYGVLSGNVTERTREMGVRAALGASRGHILALIFRDGMRLYSIRYPDWTVRGHRCDSGDCDAALRHFVCRRRCLDGVVLMLAGVSAIACWAPPWRASRVDPDIALRGE